MNNTNIKQVIVVNNELRSKLKHGKLAAQVAHASLGAILNDAEFFDDSVEILFGEYKQWYAEQFTKVVLRADNEQHMVDIYYQAKAAGLSCVLIRDSGFTVFKEPTYTCVGIGPATTEELYPITGQLKMY